MEFLLLVVAFVLLLAGAIVFTNAVEWAGIRLGLGTGAVGSILAAVATALPESVIPVVAILSGEESGQVAIGSIIGAPFLLATLAMLLVGLSSHVFAARRPQNTELEIHQPTTARDLVVFAVFLAIALVLGLVGSHAVRIVAAVVFVLAYGVYVWRTVKHGGEAGEEPKSLYFDPSKGDPPANIAIIAQIVFGIAAIVGGAQLFVTEIESIAHSAGVSPLVLALVLAPLATELPEKANSILWTRRGKDALALGNISGALVFQSMIPVSVGLAFTPWSLTTPSVLAIGCALVGGAVAFAYVLLKRRFTAPAMGCWAILYGGFVGYMVFGA